MRAGAIGAALGTILPTGAMARPAATSRAFAMATSAGLVVGDRCENPWRADIEPSGEQQERAQKIPQGRGST